MPHTVHFPAHTKIHCEPCAHHKCTGSFLPRIGEGGWHHYICTHPEAYARSSDPGVNEVHAAWRALEGGRTIGRTEEQPDWCPLLRPPNPISPS